MKNIWITVVILLTMQSFDCPDSRVITGRVTSADDGQALPAVNVVVKGTSTGTLTDVDGKYQITVPSSGGALVFSFIGYKTEEVKIGKNSTIDVALHADQQSLEEVVIVGYGEQKSSRSHRPKNIKKSADVSYERYMMAPPVIAYEENTEEYAEISENVFRDVSKEPLSTFSIDVDKASYSNVRRFINNGQRPPVDAVRIEEMINYFSYDYPQPKGEEPFGVFTEVAEAPWNAKHKLVHVGIQGKEIPTEKLPPCNLVFLIDVSGSMNDVNKLPLVKQSFSMLVDKLRAEDHVSIVVYAGASGVVLEPTSGSEKKKIINALDMLDAGGSTAGGAGLKLAYSLARKHFKKNGNNRVILATDGDFNVGESSDDAMEKLITEKRKDGVFLTVLGFGMGNYKDSKMEILADKGNGNYAYIDNITEARKTLVNEFGGTLFTIAKDVKIQVEFNPTKVKAYRLIGYENRLLKNEDFNNDKKDAGELGSGHTVTALYEIIPFGVKSEFFDIDQLKYQKEKITSSTTTDEWLTVKLRYKKPDGNVSRLITQPVKGTEVSLANASENLRWSASVAAFGMLLRESEYANNFSYEGVAALAQSARGKDEEGYRAEFVNMVKSFGLISRR